MVDQNERAREEHAAKTSWFAAELTKATRGGEVNLFGERMDEEGPCHCGEPGERYIGKKGFWCRDCAFGVHDTCECRTSGGERAEAEGDSRG